MRDLRGKFLVASAAMRDPNFARSIILIVQHGDDGAMGVIVNRPLDVSVADAIAEQVDAANEVSAPLHQGGPCPGPLMVLHAEDVLGGDEVIPRVRFSAEREQIELLMKTDLDAVKYVAGYAGWSPQQLEDEIDEGAWLVVPAEAETVFSSDERLWTKLSTHTTLGRWVDPDHMPDDPSMN